MPLAFNLSQDQTLQFNPFSPGSRRRHTHQNHGFLRTPLERSTFLVASKSQTPTLIGCFLLRISSSNPGTAPAFRRCCAKQRRTTFLHSLSGSSTPADRLLPTFLASSLALEPCPEPDPRRVAPWAAQRKRRDSAARPATLSTGIASRGRKTTSRPGRCNATTPPAQARARSVRDTGRRVAHG